MNTWKSLYNSLCLLVLLLYFFDCYFNLETKTDKKEQLSKKLLQSHLLQGCVSDMQNDTPPPPAGQLPIQMAELQ